MRRLQHVFTTVKKESPILYGIVMLNIIAAIICAIGIFVDQRTLMGVSVWLKPTKFLISVGIYILTVGFLITFYPYSNRVKHIIRNVVSWTLLIEVSIIILQAARGVQSHYNQSSLLDALLFAAMGILIATNVLVMLFFIVETFRLKLDVPKAIQRGILMGWIIIFIGSWVGQRMIAQMAHNVGIEDGGAGLPLVNWSTIAGDLRVAHFFGLHGLQLIPLFALFVHEKLKSTERKKLIAVMIFSLLYASFICFTFYQASQGRPFLGKS